MTRHAGGRPFNWSGTTVGLAMVAATTGGAIAVASWMRPDSVDLLYLIPVIATATLFGLRPALIASVSAALAYNFFFLPPLYTFTISDPQNAITFLVLTGVAIVASQLTGRLRREANVGARTATENAGIAAFSSLRVCQIEGTAAIVCEEIASLLNVSTVLLTQKERALKVIGGSPRQPDMGALDLAAAEWAFDRNEMTGRDTGTLTASDWQFHPLVTSLGVLAVLGVGNSVSSDPVAPEKRTLFSTLLGQAALAHERIKLETRAP